MLCRIWRENNIGKLEFDREREITTKYIMEHRGSFSRCVENEVLCFIIGETGYWVTKDGKAFDVSWYDPANSPFDDKHEYFHSVKALCDWLDAMITVCALENLVIEL